MDVEPVLQLAGEGVAFGFSAPKVIGAPALCRTDSARYSAEL
jgi:hypothetical protein